MSGSQRLGLLLGVLWGLGLLLMLASLPSWRRPSLTERVAPFAGKVLPGAQRRTKYGMWSIWAPIFSGWQHHVQRIASALFSLLTGDDSALKNRLQIAGIEVSVARYRITQVMWLLTGSTMGVAVWGVALTLGKAPRSIAVMLLVSLAAISAVLAHDWLLTRRIALRRDRMAAELPATAELLALAIAAGESPTAALARVGRVSSGLLADQFVVAAQAARSGESMISVLKTMARTADLPALTRMVDAMTIATNRGTPLGDVLRAQAADLRAETSRLIIESAGRKEIAMLLPVVFLVMPTVVVVALFPGWQTLSRLTS